MLARLNPAELRDPFGMSMGIQSMQSYAPPADRHQFNGIEYFEGLDYNMAFYRTLDPGIGRWLQVDPEAESFYGISPYAAMGNNPISFSDSDGDFIVAMAVGAAVGVLANGVSNAIQGQSFFNNAGMAAAMGAVGGAMAGGVANAAMNVASSYMGVDINLGGGFNLSLSPALAFGSQGFTFGANVGVGFSQEGFSAGINASGGFTNMSLGPNSLTGWTGSVGGGVMFGDKDGGFGLYTNQTFGPAGQLVAGLTGSYNGFSVTYENDGAPFGKMGDAISKLNDGQDRWRTAAASIGYGGIDLRMNLFTGDPENSDQVSMDGYTNKVHRGGNADKFRLGALSLGFRGQRIGWNSEGIRHTFQNKFAHTELKIFGIKILKNQTYFKHLGGRGSLYYESSTFSNPYSLWSF